MVPLLTYTDRTKTLVTHTRCKYGCPLRNPTPTGEPCPISDPRFEKKGCTTDLPATPGARLRYELDRDGERYLSIYRQRTAVERIFSQAKALGIERPALRNQAAITNQNTLIYLLINLRTLRRIKLRQTARAN